MPCSAPHEGPTPHAAAAAGHGTGQDLGASTHGDVRAQPRLPCARRGQPKKVVWIAAPAGAGKTSAVATYLSSRRLPTLWYNVDARDADVANVFHYLALAARLAAPRKKLALPAFTADSQGGVAAFARGFFEALCRERPAPSLLVLDDYHEAAGQLWNDVIREAISALPEGVVAIIISRNEPPPALARHVAGGEIALVGWDELRLTPARNDRTRSPLPTRLAPSAMCATFCRASRAWPTAGPLR